MSKKIWRLPDALEVIRTLQPEAMSCGYALSLGGGVLNAGFSWKDLDIVAVPGSRDDQYIGSFLDYVRSQGFKDTDVNYDHNGLTVHKFERNGLKMDLIFVHLDKTPHPSVKGKSPAELKFDS